MTLYALPNISICLQMIMYIVYFIHNILTWCLYICLHDNHILNITSFYKSNWSGIKNNKSHLFTTMINCSTLKYYYRLFWMSNLRGNWKAKRSRWHHHSLWWWHHHSLLTSLPVDHITPHINVFENQLTILSESYYMYVHIHSFYTVMPPLYNFPFFLTQK